MLVTRRIMLAVPILLVCCGETTQITENWEKLEKKLDRGVGLLDRFLEAKDPGLLDRMNVSFKQGEFIAYKPLKDFKKLAKARSVSANTIVFNNLVATKQEYLENWEVPASESWHSRFV